MVNALPQCLWDLSLVPSHASGRVRPAFPTSSSQQISDYSGTGAVSMPVIETILWFFSIQTVKLSLTTDSLLRTSVSPVGAGKVRVAVWGNALRLRSQCSFIQAGIVQSCPHSFEMLCSGCEVEKS